VRDKLTERYIQACPVARKRAPTEKPHISDMGTYRTV